MSEEVKYRVYMKHVWGGKPIKLRLFDNKEEAKIESYKTKDEMFDSWVEEEVEGEE